MDILNFFKQKRADSSNAPESGVIIHFKDGIKAYRFENYRNISIIYLSKPFSPKDSEVVKDIFTYHFFFNGELKFGETHGTLDDLRAMAVEEIDSLLA